MRERSRVFLHLQRLSDSGLVGRIGIALCETHGDVEGGGVGVVGLRVHGAADADAARVGEPLAVGAGLGIYGSDFCGAGGEDCGGGGE